MPFGNGHTGSQRKHGVPSAGLPVSGWCLLCCLLCGGLAAARGPLAQSCQPCGPSCSCAGGRAPGSCLVNCSSRGLEQRPAIGVPPAATALDLSNNRITILDVQAFKHLTSLEELDISHNMISTLEDGIFDNLFNLSYINLSLNPFLCDCKLSWLPRWVEERKVNVSQLLDTKCAQPPEVANLPLFNISFTNDVTCGAPYIACVPDNSTGAAESVILFVTVPSANLSEETCSALCYAEAQEYGGFGDQEQCLCGVALEPNSSSGCLPFCTEDSARRACGGPSLVRSSFPARLHASFTGPHRPHSLHHMLAFNVSIPVAVSTLQWDFGDGSGLLNTTKNAALHQYALPGRYNITVTLFVGARVTSVQTDVEVVAPPEQIDLQCPTLVRTNESLDLRIRNRGGTNLAVVYSITAETEEPGKVVHPMCPSDGLVFPGNNHCYQLVVEKAQWLEAQQHCQVHGDGELAFVSSPEMKSFLVSHVIRGLDVWIGFNDFASAGAQQRGEGFNLESCQNWLPGEPHPSNADHCVRMGPTGQCNTDLCMAKHSYVCEYKPKGILLNAENFYVGDPAFDTPRSVRYVTREASLPAPLDTVETMVFPSLEFQQEAFLTALEFVTQELQRSIHVRFQVHRPTRREGYKEGKNATYPFRTSQDIGNWTLLECPAGFQWCHLTNTCLSLSSCCSPVECANDSITNSTNSLSWHNESQLSYELLKEFLFTIPANTSAQYLVMFKGEDTFVRPKDVFSIQHDAAPGLFLQCQPSTLSPYRMNYLSTNSSDWVPSLSANLSSAIWKNDTVCSLRVLYATEQVTPLISQHNPGLERHGLYTVKATVDNGVFSANLSCSFWVTSLVSGLRVIHPSPHSGKVYVPTNHSSLVVKISSGVNATASWLGENRTFPFEGACPPAIVPLTADCTRDNNDTWFSVVELSAGGESVSTRLLVVENSVSSQNITVKVKMEEPIRGLRATPDPETRVLLNTRVSYIPVMEAGSDVTFRWTVDDKPSFTFYNVVFNVIYQSPAVYKLSLTASNHVSNVTVDYNVTVEKMNRMKDLTVSEIPLVLPQNTTVELTARVQIDSAVDAAFKWDFGDGGHEIYQFKPPYNESFLIPDPSVHQVVIEHNVSYTYQVPGEYILVVLVSNSFENLTHQIPVHVHTYLTDLTVEADADVLVVGRPVTFKAYPLPSPYGVWYTWDFGDGSSLLLESQPRVTHSYQTRGVYNVSLTANNTISSMETHQRYRVFEEITGLRVSSDEVAEQGISISINASVETGDNITWIFDMGDGTILMSTVPEVKHRYEKDVNCCTINVTAVNPVNSVSQTVPVRVFVLEVLKIEPSSCILEHPNVQFTAYVSGNSENYIFDWTFGDGSSNVTVSGDPVVTHNFTHSGIFSLSLILSSSVNKAHYFTIVCVEPEIVNVTLLPSKRFVSLGEEINFQVSALPLYQYRYHWDFGTNDSARSGGTEVSYTYKSTGIYLVTVTVSNNVSFNNDTAFVEVQEPVGVAKIEYNGTRVLELNQIYLFSASGNGTKVSYYWDLGDGCNQLGPIITHSYNNTGNYTISLTGWNNVSNSESRLNLTVKRRLQGLTINASRTVVPLNGSVSFVATLLAGNASRYSWILCDRCTPIQGSYTISYTFRSVGTFNVIVTAENEISSLQDSIFVYVLQQIEGLQIASSDLVEDAYFPTNKTLHLQAVVRDGTNISYSWMALKDSTPVQTFSGKIFSLSILEAGNYTIYLKATNMLGSTAVNRTVEFIESIGLLKPSAFPNPAAINASVNISTSVTSGTCLIYIWHLEDGFSPVTVEPFIIHSFQRPGATAVTVTAENKIGSTNASVYIFIQEPVVGLRIGTAELDSYIPSGSVVTFSGELEKGTNVTWLWELPKGLQTGQTVAVTFPKAGFFSVHLNVSNDISWAVASKNITVQDRIEGLELFVSKKVVEPGEQISFVISMSSGSSVSYSVNISGGYSVVLNGSRFTHEFTESGDYLVMVMVQNEVSRERTQVLISVLEAIRDLRLVNCCEKGIPTGTKKIFTAQVGSGSRVSYSWQFSLQKEHSRALVSLAGRSVSYAPAAPGLLEIHLSAFNDLGSLNITRVIQVQDPIVQVSLKPALSFVNRTVLFEASVQPSAWQVVFCWNFGDGSPAQITEVAAANYSYLKAGDYQVEVNATNLVSFMIAHLTVTVRVLECEEPEVELALPTQVVMKRSQRNYLEAQIDLRGCVKYQTEYLWEIYRAPSCLHFDDADRVHLLSVDVSRPQLVIPKLALAVGNYCFIFFVSFGDTPLSKSIFANVTVTPSKLVPIIDGGSYRVWSNTRDLILDGEKSYDPNLDDGEQTPLLYRWSCTSCSKQSSPAGCSLHFSATGGVITISKAILEADVEYTFDLSVWKMGLNPESTNQTVLIKKGKVPIVSLECVSCKAQSVYEVSKSSYVYLEGTCRNCQNDSKLGRWAAHSFKNKSLVLDKTTTSTGNTGMNLVLRPGALKDGEGYTFTLHITDLTTGEEGYASIDLLPNRPPIGGLCQLSPNGEVKALMAKVHFECAGWRDTEDEEAPLVYILLATRCKAGQCEEFSMYKGSRSEHSAFLPPGFSANSFLVYVSVLVQDQLGATVMALNRSMTITLPTPAARVHSLSHWLYNQTDTVLQGLVKQGDPQHVIEYSLALITILNEHEHLMGSEAETGNELDLRTWTRRNITETLISLNVNTVDDIQQISAALAQCMVASKELLCRSCLTGTLNKLESMMAILQGETTQGIMTPTAIADNILNITGDLIHLVNTVPQESKLQELCNDPHRLQVASQAYRLSSSLMRILMKSRVLNEEPLELVGGEIVAKGKRSDPLNLLCYENTLDCQFSIPQAFNTTFSDLTDVIQVMFRMDSNPFPFGYISNYTVSTEVASMEFQTNNGTQIPIGSLDAEKAITVMVSNNGMTNISAGSAIIQGKTSVNLVVTTENNNREAGLHFQLTYRVLNDRYILSELEPFIAAYLSLSPAPNENNCSAAKKIGLEAVERRDHKRYTFFISPITDDTTKDYYFNITNHFSWSPVEVTLSLYTSLCQYFCEQERRWKTEGIIPLEETSPDQAVCLTQHLTAFGASLFVPPNSVQFIFPAPGPGLNYIVLLTCAVCFVTYSVAMLIVHKLDLIDINRVGVIPFCGKNGMYKYEILVKTGWGRGSGTTAHVGLTLYGVDNKSGHRHLDGENAFHRNSLDVFQIATEQSLGSVWKIRIWHDNKGLSPSWYLQHVIVRDLQTSKSYFFLVNDWLSVESEESDGMVEKEVYAASETELRSFPRIFVAELQRGFFEKHVWLSMWDRPPRSRFTRVQRATCCSALIFLFLCANAVWYGVVGDVHLSHVAVSNLIPLSVDTVAVGLVSSVVVYPLYLVILFLFRMARSKASISHTLTHSDQQSLEIDNYLDSSLLESSFLTFPGIRAEAFSEQTKTDLFLDDSKSLIRWHSSEALLNWPDLLSDPSIMGNTIQKLKRGRASRHLGLEVPLPAEEDSVSLGLHHGQPKYFSASDEDLIRQILADGASGISQDTGHYARAETDLVSGLSSVFGEKTETIMLQRLNEKGQNIAAPPREVSRSAKSTWTVVDHTFRKRLLPHWCSYLAHAVSLLFFATSIGVSVWIGVGFTSSVALMWLISGIFSFLASFLVWEPLKVLLEALYFALVAKRLHPEEDDTLVEYPFVEHVSEKINKVRPPQGFALFQAKEEARKVKLLHKMLKSFLIYMLFLLVTLLTNYGDASRNGRAFLLQSSLKQQLGGEEFLRIKRSDEFWAWMSQVLLPSLYNNQSGRESCSTMLGVPRLRQLRLQEAECLDTIHDFRSGTDAPVAAKKCTYGSNGFNTGDYAVGWKRVSVNLTQTWSYSPPDLAGVWYWGYVSVYDSGGYIQELGATLEESRAHVDYLQQNNWINNMSRAVFVELTQYNPSVDLHAAVTLRLEFPTAGRAVAAIAVGSFPLLRLSGGVTLQLVMMVFLMAFVVYFVVSESLFIKKEGRAYFALFGSYSQWLLILLTTCAVVVHLSQATIADQQWAKYLKNRKGFTSFYQVAFLNSVFNSLAASLLFLLTVKAAQQLRFVRQWSVFGKTLQKSTKELAAAGLALALLVLAYTQLGFLLFSSCSESFHSFSSSLLLLVAAVRGRVNLRLCLPEPSGLYYLFCASYIVLEMWIVLRLFAAVLVHSYREMNFELYRPAFEPQDYEMVELFVRRLKLWMGFSKVKEFRHKVRFEGMEPLPSRSSSDKSFRGPTPSAASDSSRASTSSSQLDGLSLVLSTRESSEVDADVQRLLSLFEMLLAQFDRVNQVTEDVYRMEQQLEDSQSRRTRMKYIQMTEDLLSRYRLGCTDQGPQGLYPENFSNTDLHPPRDPLLPSPPASALGALQSSTGCVPSRIVRASRGLSVASLLSPHKTYATTAPAVRKKKPLRAKNRVHPSIK
ncbi:polycystin-1 isoform X1 [Mauremys reevesii]|uniref:polycystin-1 isoform X1 n=1 Tax=Mauremys reevesii TaxID=260615 RepID=UPI00193EF1E1|nr:polycystin-1 isoform X1 [Mauremys reevesii]